MLLRRVFENRRRINQRRKYKMRGNWRDWRDWRTQKITGR